ncbi:unnamed protein product [Cyprideis torosa]|uniref:MATH domain-containing protein n=1 Tax=Cyprideis torosa TaxID=163714 RepID=A0A7R8WEJ3_9CRUS|nr:unnamed protein product [Cyprideis torosa]CAG0889882.1 unnamed protein product [Cyprideis torosa]
MESCFFLSTDYIRWVDGGDFCGRRHNGSLAEFASHKKLKAFETFISTIPHATKEELWDAEHAWIGGAILDGSVWRWNSSGERLDSSISEEFPTDNFYGLTINVHSKEMVPFKLQSPSLSPGHQTIHSYVCETNQRVAKQDGHSDSQTIARNYSECQEELRRTQDELVEVQIQALVAECACPSLTDCQEELEQVRDHAFVVGVEQQQLLALKDERISVLEAEAEVKDQRISRLIHLNLSLKEELEKRKKTPTGVPATTEAAASLKEQPEPAKPVEQAADFLIPNMTFTIKKSAYQGDTSKGEAKSNVIEAGGLRWSVSFWMSVWPRFMVHVEGGRGAPSTWTLSAQFLTLNLLRKGGEGRAPLTHRLQEATFSSDQRVVGMVPGWSWITLTNPSWGFLDAEGALQVEVYFEGASMSPTPPPQRPTVWEAEATLQLRGVNSTLRDWGDMIFSPSVHVGGVDWRVWVGRDGGSYYVRLLCNVEERNDWSLKADWTITLLTTKGAGKEKKTEGAEVSRGAPWTRSLLSISPNSIGNYLTGDTASIAVKISVHH